MCSAVCGVRWQCGGPDRRAWVSTQCHVRDVVVDREARARRVAPRAASGGAWGACVCGGRGTRERATPTESDSEIQYDISGVVYSPYRNFTLRENLKPGHLPVQRSQVRRILAIPDPPWPLRPQPPPGERRRDCVGPLAIRMCVQQQLHHLVYIWLGLRPEHEVRVWVEVGAAARAGVQRTALSVSGTLRL